MTPAPSPGDGTSAPGPGAPGPGALGAAACRKLAVRAARPLDPARGMAIKRHVHEVDLDVDAATFARAFRAVLVTPGADFGAVRVKRRPERVGLPFERGERFHGCFSLTRLAARTPFVPRAALTWLEDNLLSDYAEIVELDELRGRYRYLEGTPIAGSSSFEITPLPHGAGCRFRQVFEFQEIGGLALSVLHRFGVRAHDDVVRAQVAQAAARVGARILRTTMH